MRKARHRPATTRLGLLLLLLCGATPPAVPQQEAPTRLIRMAAGEGARVFVGSEQRGVVVRLGSPSSSAPSAPGLKFIDSGGRLESICCRAAAGSRCLTERGVALGTVEKDVLARYGPPRQRGGKVLAYSGIRFTLGSGDTGGVTAICVTPR